MTGALTMLAINLAVLMAAILLLWAYSVKIRDVSFITGDIHTFFAGSVSRTGRAKNSVAGLDPASSTERSNMWLSDSVGSLISAGTPGW